MLLQVATQIMKQMIDQFAVYDLFGRENYEYYARVTGRVLRVQDEWICSFRYPIPPRGKSAQQNYACECRSLSGNKTKTFFFCGVESNNFENFLFAVKLSLEAEKTWLQCECARWRLCMYCHLNQTRRFQPNINGCSSTRQGESPDLDYEGTYN